MSQTPVFLTLDFNHTKVNGFYQSKDTLFAEYGLDTCKKTLLFISSFAYVNALQHHMAVAENFMNKDEIMEKIVYATDSQKEILKWMKRFLSENRDTVLIYRPHPVESDSKELYKIAEEHANFKIIKDYAVGQWISTCDKIYIWVSTSIAQVYSLKKPCYVLQPYQMIDSQSPEYFQYAECITDYKAFHNSIDSDDDAFPIEKDIFETFYRFDDEFSYIRDL